MAGRVRGLADPFVAAGPAGARVRTRLRVTPADAEVLAATGALLGSLASADLAARCAEGRLNAQGRAALRAARKQSLTSRSSSRWAGVVVDPAYTTRWAADFWLAPLRDRDEVTTGHHAAAVVIGRRAHGHKARRREGVTGGDQRIAARRAAPRAPHAGHATRNGRTPGATRQPPRRRNTAPASRGHPPDQATEDRPRSPAEPILTIAQ
jgi:hypothetical protein